MGSFQHVSYNTHLSHNQPIISNTNECMYVFVYTRVSSSLNVGVGYESGAFLLYRGDGYVLAYREAGVGACGDSFGNAGVSADCRKV